MTSTFPTSRANSQTLRYGIKEMQSKKEALITLETALKKRINEFRELCLKEGELTGQLPSDYPLQPREPIPQVRRRVKYSEQPCFSRTLFHSVAKNNLDQTKNCIEKGASACTTNRDGRTLLHYAINNDNVQIVNILLENGADVTRATNRGNTPLHTAVLKGNNEIVEMLLKHVSPDKLNSFINATTSTGNTPLHVAVEKGYMDITKTLLKYGAIYNLKSSVVA